MGEALRARGRHLIRHEALDPYLAEFVWGQTQYEIARRIGIMTRRGVLGDEVAALLLGETLDSIIANVSIVRSSSYSQFEAEARRRVPRDPDDWPTVALALSTGTAIWTQDADFLGCGVATWTTETLLAQLEG